MVQAHIIVSGMVQGIGYRYFVQRAARRLELTGWVRNLFTGEVEIEAEGLRGPIEALIKELRTGNPYAVVRNVDVEWNKASGKYAGFDIAF
ncbi:MAG TPA: acylphosphatase [bacterium]